MGSSHTTMSKPRAKAPEKKRHPRERPAPERTGDTRYAFARQGVDSPGATIPGNVRSFAEKRFGRSFADVRLHTDGGAARAAQRMNAAAYALGRDIAFNAGYYAPHT